jgi:hypothetical protein
MLTWGLWHGEKHTLELYSAPLPVVLLVSLAEKFAYWPLVILQWVRLPAFVRSWKRKWPGYDEAYPFEYCYRTNLSEFYYPVYNAVVAWAYRRLKRCSVSLDLSDAQVRAIVKSIPSVGMECEQQANSPSNEATEKGE